MFCQGDIYYCLDSLENRKIKNYIVIMYSYSPRKEQDCRCRCQCVNQIDNKNLIHEEPVRDSPTKGNYESTPQPGQFPPPEPPNGDYGLWELQFCKWWGWTWVKKGDTQVTTAAAPKEIYVPMVQPQVQERAQVIKAEQSPLTKPEAVKKKAGRGCLGCCVNSDTEDEYRPAAKIKEPVNDGSITIMAPADGYGVTTATNDNGATATNDVGVRSATIDQAGDVKRSWRKPKRTDSREITGTSSVFLKKKHSVLNDICCCCGQKTNATGLRKNSKNAGTQIEEVVPLKKSIKTSSEGLVEPKKVSSVTYQDQLDPTRQSVQSSTSALPYFVPVAAAQTQRAGSLVAEQQTQVYAPPAARQQPQREVYAPPAAGQQTQRDTYASLAGGQRTQKDQVIGISSTCSCFECNYYCSCDQPPPIAEPRAMSISSQTSNKLKETKTAETQTFIEMKEQATKTSDTLISPREEPVKVCTRCNRPKKCTKCGRHAEVPSSSPTNCPARQSVGAGQAMYCSSAADCPLRQRTNGGCSSAANCPLRQSYRTNGGTDRFGCSAANCAQRQSIGTMECSSPTNCAPRQAVGACQTGCGTDKIINYCLINNLRKPSMGDLFKYKKDNFSTLQKSLDILVKNNINIMHLLNDKKFTPEHKTTNFVDAKVSTFSIDVKKPDEEHGSLLTAVCDAILSSHKFDKEKNYPLKVSISKSTDRSFVSRDSLSSHGFLETILNDLHFPHVSLRSNNEIHKDIGIQVSNHRKCSVSTKTVGRLSRKRSKTFSRPSKILTDSLKTRRKQNPRNEEHKLLGSDKSLTTIFKSSDESLCKTPVKFDFQSATGSKTPNLRGIDELLSSIRFNYANQTKENETNPPGTSHVREKSKTKRTSD